MSIEVAPGVVLTRREIVAIFTQGVRRPDPDSPPERGRKPLIRKDYRGTGPSVVLTSDGRWIRSPHPVRTLLRRLRALEAAVSAPD